MGHNRYLICTRTRGDWQLLPMLTSIALAKNYDLLLSLDTGGSVPKEAKELIVGIGLYGSDVYITDKYTGLGGSMRAIMEYVNQYPNWDGLFFIDSDFIFSRDDLEFLTHIAQYSPGIHSVVQLQLDKEYSQYLDDQARRILFVDPAFSYVPMPEFNKVPATDWEFFQECGGLADLLYFSNVFRIRGVELYKHFLYPRVLHLFQFDKYKSWLSYSDQQWEDALVRSNQFETVDQLQEYIRGGMIT